MKVHCPEGRETFDDDETTEEAPTLKLRPPSSQPKADRSTTDDASLGPYRCRRLGGVRERPDALVAAAVCVRGSGRFAHSFEDGRDVASVTSERLGGAGLNGGRSVCGISEGVMRDSGRGAACRQS
jgi:hypothetical protein